MDDSDQEKVRQANLAQLVINENSIEAEKRREERRQVNVREKQQENDRLDFSRYKKESDRNQFSNFRPPNQYWLSPQDKLILEFYEAQCAEKIKKRSSIIFSNHLSTRGTTVLRLLLT
jgi:protein involved in polysaccharide export with SLBB domain